MALDVYFKEDVQNILRATLVASEGSAALVGELLEDPELDQLTAGKLMYVYKRGFASALGAIALAFGLEVAPLTRQVTREVTREVTPAAGRISQGTRPALRGGSSNRALPGGGGSDALEELDLGGFLWARSEHGGQRG